MEKGQTDVWENIHDQFKLGGKQKWFKEKQQVFEHNRRAKSKLSKII